ncbi:MAG: DUF1579 family protein [Candidatus Zixiibacteriota bacterium]
MKKSLMIVALMAMACLMALPALAEEPAKPSGEQMQMPPMGPPEEMKQLAFLEGTWDVVSNFNISMDPTKEQWQESKATAVYSYIVDGAAMQCVYDGGADMMPGMPPFKGFMLQAYNRETKKWQATWVDNMSGSISLYTGTHDAGKSVLEGEDMMGGQKWWTRMTSYDETPGAFKWKMEMSMDGGKTFVTSGTATYTKRK